MATDIISFYWKTIAQIGTLTLDASLSEGHKGSVEVTEEPVEQGADITDHRRRKPDVITIEGVVSNNPLPDPNAPLVTQTAPNGQTFQSRSARVAGRAETAYQTLLTLLDSPNLITVITAIRTYQNMTMVSLDVPRDAKIGDSLKFTAVLQDIRIVQNATVQVSSSTPRAQKKADLNKKAAAPAATALSNKTFAKSAKDKLNGILNSPNFSADPIGTFTKALGGH